MKIPNPKSQIPKQAMFWKKGAAGAADCFLCEFRCHIPDGKRGLCCVRENSGGTLYSLVYEKAISAAVDPIEKKPFFHFLPGSTSLSIATVGCNFRCLHCQNHTIAQLPRDHGGMIEGEKLTSMDVVNLALRGECAGISYTYTEPTVFFEYAYDTARLANEKGLKNNFVTNGYMSVEALETIKPVLDAANVDLKGFNEETHKRRTGASIEPVKRNIRLMHQMGIWVEVTTLVIPGENDSDTELSGIAEFLAAIDKNIPWHVSAFHPAYKMIDIPRTPLKTIMNACNIGKGAGLHYVYGGNVTGEKCENTICPGCGHTVIRRMGFSVLENSLKSGNCSRCGKKIAGVFQ